VSCLARLSLLFPLYSLYAINGPMTIVCAINYAHSVTHEPAAVSLENSGIADCDQRCGPRNRAVNGRYSTEPLLALTAPTHKLPFREMAAQDADVWRPCGCRRDFRSVYSLAE